MLRTVLGTQQASRLTCKSMKANSTFSTYLLPLTALREGGSTELASHGTDQRYSRYPRILKQEYHLTTSGPIDKLPTRDCIGLQARAQPPALFITFHRWHLENNHNDFLLSSAPERWVPLGVNMRI